MSKNQLIVFGSAVAFIVLLALVGVLVQTGRRRRMADDMAKARELREKENEQTRIQAREQAADAASAEARTVQARLAAEKLHRAATARAQASRDSFERAGEHHRKPRDLDPAGDRWREHELTGQRRQENVPGEDQRH